MPNVDWKGYIEIGIKVLALISVFFGVFKYFDQIDRQRLTDKRQISMAYIDEHSANIAGLEQEISFFLAPYISIFGSDRFELGSTEPISDFEMRQILIGVFITPSGDAPPQAKKWLQILRYYDRVWICASQYHCDIEYLESYICSHAKLAFSKYGRLVELYHKTYTGQLGGKLSTGFGVREIANMCTT